MMVWLLFRAVSQGQKMMVAIWFFVRYLVLTLRHKHYI